MTDVEPEMHLFSVAHILVGAKAQGFQLLVAMSFSECFAAAGAKEDGKVASVDIYSSSMNIEKHIWKIPFSQRIGNSSRFVEWL